MRSKGREAMPQIDLTDKEIERLLRLVGDYKPEDEVAYSQTEDCRIGRNVYGKLKAARRSPVQIIAEEMRRYAESGELFELHTETIHNMLNAISGWAERLEQLEDATP